MRNIQRWIALGVVVFLVAGCASIIHGSKQDIRVMSDPTGAVVRVNLNNISATTPGVLSLNRKEVGYILTFEKQGYKPVEIGLTRTSDGWVWGNILFGGIIGLVIDFTSGSAYKLTPEEVHAVLGQRGASLREGKGSILVFADMEQLPESIRAKRGVL